ncbi:cell division initiation protein [Ruminiclostridium sufflavum DSM 19573]|uniref:Cell division initiation protein n=1 Tax=Ruminiclostridium sufflavum DSM 19573 TaxID=1121337 RepID=A0A318XGC7_9FIRM|nr:DivIVA domain-containing protein [Ruminiclostridium sufflavum]PYG84992.1 cell division initiation protein [Ruminiclostridium sufflavum DSM 19573]
MNYTPEELRGICLKKSVINGYCKRQVDNLLALINEDYNRQLMDNEELKGKVASLNEAINHYKLLEEALQHSILVAQHTSEQVKANACEKARLITEEAEANAKKLTDEAHQEVAKCKTRCEELKSELISYKSKSELMLQAQLKILKQMSPE